jgi:F-type H+-transporting ATPase subunit delta
MNHSTISVRYARALFETALEKKNLDKVHDDMVYIADLCKNPEIKEFLVNPVIVPSRKMAAFRKLLEGKVQSVTLSLVDLLCKNGRESHLPDIARAFRHETMRHKGITEAVLTTAVPVNNAVREQVIDLIEKGFSTKVMLTEVVDPDIIGGFVLRVEDNFIDASLKNKLRKVKKELLEGIKSR